jgi:hypothetical protein
MVFGLQAKTVATQVGRQEAARNFGLRIAESARKEQRGGNFGFRISDCGIRPQRAKGQEPDVRGQRSEVSGRKSVAVRPISDCELRIAE